MYYVCTWIIHMCIYTYMYIHTYALNVEKTPFTPTPYHVRWSFANYSFKHTLNFKVTATTHNRNI